MNRRGLILGSGFGAALAAAGLWFASGQKTTDKKAVRILGEDSSNLQAIAGHLSEKNVKAAYPNIVEATDFSTAATKAMTGFAQRSSAYDIVLGYNFSLSPYVQNGYVTTLADVKRIAPEEPYEFEQDILPNVWKELGYYLMPPFDNLSRTQPIAYPFSANTMVLVWDEQVFSDPKVRTEYRSKFGRDFSPPTTWEEFATVARLVPVANPAFSGVALQGAPDGWLYYEWMNFLFGMGGKVMDKSYGWQSDKHTPLMLRTLEATRAAEYYVGLKSVNAGDFYSTDALRQRDLMLSHKAAFAIMWTDYIPDLAKAGGFGFAPIPGAKSMIAGGSFFLNSKSQSLKESVTLIAHLLSKPVQKQLAMNGLFPATRSALSDPDVLAKPYMPAVKASLERGVYMLEAGIDSSLISEKITDALQSAWRGDIPASRVGVQAMEAIASLRLR